MNADRTGEWVCKCRRCHGVHNTADAVQYAYELWSDNPQQALVLAFAPFGETARSSLTVPFLDGEPDVLGLPDLRVWVFSFRPGCIAVPTEGDIARWERWRTGETNVVDWMIIDGHRWTSVAGVAKALREQCPIPRPEVYSNYWWRA